MSNTQRTQPHGSTSAKRPRTDLEPHDEVLKDHWSRGMISVKTKEQKRLVDECCRITNLTHKQVSNWITTQKRKLKGPEESIKIKSGCRKKSAKDIFYSRKLPQLGHLKPRQRMAVAAADWNLIKGSDAASSYSAEAENVKTNQQLAQEGDIDAHTNVTTHMYRKLLKLITSLESNGVEVCAFAYDKCTGKCERFGSEVGLKFLNHRNDLDSLFLNFIGGGISMKPDITKVRNEVADLFNVKYAALTGKKHCSYKAVLVDKTVQVVGLPDGVSFAAPSSYGYTKCTSILAQANKLSFAYVSEVVDVAPLPEALEAGCSDHPIDEQNVSEVAAVAPLAEAVEAGCRYDPIDWQNVSEVVAVSPVAAAVEAGCSGHAIDFQNVSEVVDIAPLTEAVEAGCCDDPINGQKVVDEPSLAEAAEADGSDKRQSKRLMGKGRKVWSTKRTCKKAAKDEKKSTTKKKDDNSNVYLMEKILNTKVVRGKVYFQIKWLGYPDAESTWEPASHLIWDQIAEKYKQ